MNVNFFVSERLIMSPPIFPYPEIRQSHSMPVNIFDDVSASPKIRFNTGTALNGVEQYQSELPSVSGTDNTNWNMTQWGTSASEIFDPTSPIINDPLDQDSLLGTADYSWHTGDASGASSGFVVYGSPGNYTYRLSVAGGNVRDVFLQTATSSTAPAYTFNNAMAFTANERVSAAAPLDGVGYVGNDFTVAFNATNSPYYDPSLPTFGVFLQVPIADTRGQPDAYSTLAYDSTTGSWSGMFNVSGNGVAYLPATSDTGSLHAVTIDLNAAIDQMIASMVAQGTDTNSSALENLANWSLSSMFIGPESVSGMQAGGGALSFDVNDPNVSYDDTTQESYTSDSQEIVTISGQDTDASPTSVTTAASQVTTPTGAGQTLTLTATSGTVSVSSNADDTIASSNSAQVALHISASATDTAIGNGYALSADGSGGLTTSGSFSTLDLTNTGLSTIGGTLSGTSATIDNANATFALLLAGDTSLHVEAGQGTIDSASSDATLTIFTNNNTMTVSNSASAVEVIVAGQNGPVDNALTVNGGGVQQIWNGNENLTFLAGTDTGGPSMFAPFSDDAPQAYLGIQGGANSVTLNLQKTTVWATGGVTTVTGSQNASAADLLVTDGGQIDVTGDEGIFDLVAFHSQNVTDTITGGNDTETLFADSVNLIVRASDTLSGTQTIVASMSTENNLGTTATIDGGATQQNIYTGTKNVVVNASQTVSGNHILMAVQGGASVFNGGLEGATIHDWGGDLTAYLGTQTGAMTLDADMSKIGTLGLYGFNPGTETVTLTGITNPADIQLATSQGNTTISVTGESGHITLYGTTGISLHSIGASSVLLS